MGLFDTLFSKKVEVRADTAVDADSLLASLSTEEITIETAMDIPVVAACVNFISNIISDLPVRLYDDVTEIGDDGRLKLVNSECGDLLDTKQLVHALVRDFLLSGGGYAYVERRKNAVQSIRYIEPNYISEVKNFDPIFKKSDFIVNGKKYKEYEILRLLRNTVDGVKGVGIVEEQNRVLDALLTAIRYEKRVYKTGNARGYVQSDAKLTQEAVNQLKSSWRDLYSEDSDKIMVLNAGLKYNSIAQTTADTQLIESKQRNFDEICAAFGIVPSVLTGGASEQDWYTTIQNAIVPVASQLGNAYTRFLLLETEKEKGYVFELDLDGLMDADTLKRYQGYELALRNGLLSISEIRKREGLDPLDVPYLKLGLADVLLNTQDGTIYTPNTNQFMGLGEDKVEKPDEKEVIE